MKKTQFSFDLMFLLFIPSVCMYGLLYFIFRDIQYIEKDFISQLAFLPIFYFFSSIIIDNVMARREKMKLMKNINMLIGVFFSEFGNDFIRLCTKFDVNIETYECFFKHSGKWQDGDYNNAIKYVKNHSYKVDLKRASLEELKTYLLGNRQHLVTIMENSNLMEHDAFTDLLLAISHLCEEFKYRDLEQQTAADYAHLEVDLIRAYSLIGAEWLNYSKHLKDEYPHLYSLSLMYNPFLAK